MTTYAEFKEFYLRTIWREGDAALEADLDRLIKAAEARISRDLKENTLATDISVTVASSSTDSFIDLPGNFGEAITVSINGNPPARVLSVPELQMMQKTGCRNDGVYAIYGNKLHFIRDLNNSAVVELTYYMNVIAYATDPVLPFYDTHPDFYIAAVHVQVYDYLRDYALSQEYNGKYANLLEGMIRNSNYKMFPSGQLLDWNKPLGNSPVTGGGGSGDSGAYAKAVEALNAANAAQETANEALEAAENAGGTKADLRTPGMLPRDSWDREAWTSGANWFNITNQGPATQTLPDHEFDVSVGLAGETSVLIDNDGIIATKCLFRREFGTDYLIKVKYEVEEGGASSLLLTLLGYTDAETAGGGFQRDAVAISGAGIAYTVINSSRLTQFDYIRPAVEPNAGNGVRIFWLDVIPVRDYFNFYDFEPDADASDAFDRAIAATLSATRPWLDLRNGTFDVTRPVENTAQSSRWRNGIIRVDNNSVPREAFAGGTEDGDGVPRQKGIVRQMGLYQTYEYVTLQNTGGPIMITTVDPRGWIVTEGRCVANGYEDVGTRGHRYRNLQVQNYDDYGFRYASSSGGGFRAESAHPRQRVTFGTFDYLDADVNRGYGFLLDSNDGILHDCVPVNGEFPVRQIDGGTIDLLGVHPWGQRTAYKRKYFGPANTPIQTTIQIRDPSQIISFDSGLVDVTRDPDTWEVIVTPLVEILEEDATEVVIWRDSVNALLGGWNTNWEGAYFDGGSIRMTRPGHRFGDGCAGIAPSGGNVIALFEWQPTLTRLTDNPRSELWQAMNPAYAPKRSIVYPRLGGVVAPPVDVATMESWYGRASDEGGHVFSKLGTAAGPIAAFNTLSNQARLNLQTASALLGIIAYNGDPNGNVIANAGSLCLNTAPGALGAGVGQLFFKTSNGNALGWRPVSRSAGYQELTLDAEEQITAGVLGNRGIARDTAVLTANRIRPVSASGLSPNSVIEYHCQVTGGFTVELREGTAAGTLLHTASAGDIVTLVWDGTDFQVMNIIAGTVPA